MFKKKIVLGSANFSSGYGLRKSKGISVKDLNKIYKILIRNNINSIDTAFSYPESEKKISSSKLKKLNISTKISFLNYNKKSSVPILNLVKKSLKKFKKNFFYSIYFHNSKDLFGPNGKKFYEDIVQLKKKKLIKKIGVSVYSPEELKKLLKNYYFDIVQIPINVFDRRFLKKNYLQKLKKKGIEIYARSIFLQGILLLNKKSLPKYFKKWSKIFQKWDEWNINNHQKKILTCINFVKKIKYLDKIVIGVSNSEQMKEIIKLTRIKKIKYPKKIFSTSKSLVDPRLWV
jgi:aryl-alcohol dehydrogenase-like predicted oxidoreductase